MKYRVIKLANGFFTIQLGAAQYGRFQSPPSDGVVRATLRRYKVI